MTDSKPVTPPAAPAPAPAAPPPPQELVIEATVRGEKITLKGQDEVRKYVQLGINATQIEQKAQALAEKAKADAEHAQKWNNFTAWGAMHPDRAAMIDRIYRGEPLPTNKEPDDDGEPAPTRGNAPTSAREAELIERLARLESVVTQTTNRETTRNFESQLETAVKSQLYLANNADAAEVAKGLAAKFLAEGKADNMDVAAKLASQALERIAQRDLQLLADARERKQRELSLPPPTGGGPPPIPDEIKNLSYKDVQKGKLAKEAKAFISNRIRAMTSGPQ